MIKSLAKRRWIRIEDVVLVEKCDIRVAVGIRLSILLNVKASSELQSFRVSEFLLIAVSVANTLDSRYYCPI